MTVAWYGHLKFKAAPLWLAVLGSWGIALFEYLLQVPANRIGYRVLNAYQLKVMQEAITLVVFMVFAAVWLGEGIPAPLPGVVRADSRGGRRRVPMTPLARALLRWYDGAKRDLPWRRAPSPYKTLVSELMLQQTVVATVRPYFDRFLRRFPDAGRWRRRATTR